MQQQRLGGLSPPPAQAPSLHVIQEALTQPTTHRFRRPLHHRSKPLSRNRNRRRSSSNEWAPWCRPMDRSVGTPPRRRGEATLAGEMAVATGARVGGRMLPPRTFASLRCSLCHPTTTPRVCWNNSKDESVATSSRCSPTRPHPRLVEWAEVSRTSQGIDQRRNSNCNNNSSSTRGCHPASALGRFPPARATLSSQRLFSSEKSDPLPRTTFARPVSTVAV